MAKEKLHELKQTPNVFQARGKVTGVKKKNFFTNGVTTNGTEYQAVEFGVQIDTNKTVYVTLNAFVRDAVYYSKRGEKGTKSIVKSVPWVNRKQCPGDGFQLIGVNISTGRDADGNNVNEKMTEYDAVSWLRDNLNDGDDVFIRGKLEFSSYTNKKGEKSRRTRLVPTQISYCKRPVDFTEEGFTPMCEFENTLVFSAIEQETDDELKPTGRYILSGYSIGYNTVEDVSFIIDADHGKLAKNLRKAMKPGYSINTFGKVNVVIDVSTEEEDDGWGEASPLERINSPVRREYIVYKADPSTIDKDTYSEEDIAKAIKNINDAKTVKANFGESNSESDDSDWGSDDDFGDEEW